MQQEKLVTQRLLAAAYYFDQNDSKWRCKSENGCKVGDWVLEVSIGVKARFQHGQQSLLNAVGRLLFVGKGCLSCLDQRHEKDETDVDEENTKGDGFHHYAQDIYFLETPDGRLAHWSNCLFVSLDTIFMDSFNHKEDGTPYIPGTPEKLFWLHGNQNESLDWAYDRDGRVKSDDFLQNECKRQAAECVEAALKRHKVHDLFARAVAYL